jgi:hypothetical protein
LQVTSEGLEPQIGSDPHYDGPSERVSLIIKGKINRTEKYKKDLRTPPAWGAPMSVGIYIPVIAQ